MGREKGFRKVAQEFVVFVFDGDGKDQEKNQQMETLFGPLVHDIPKFRYMPLFWADHLDGRRFLSFSERKHFLRRMKFGVTSTHSSSAM